MNNIIALTLSLFFFTNLVFADEIREAHLQVSKSLLNLSVSSTDTITGLSKVSHFTGILVTGEGDVISTKHQFREHDKNVSIRGSFWNRHNEIFQLKIVTYLDGLDVILLKIVHPRNLPDKIEIDRNNDFHVLQRVHTVGFARGDIWLPNEGIVLEVSDPEAPAYVGLKLSIYEGMSGSPVYNYKNKKLIGIIKGSSKKIPEYTLMLPTRYFHRIIPELEISKPEVQPEILREIDKRNRIEVAREIKKSDWDDSEFGPDEFVFSIEIPGISSAEYEIVYAIVGTPQRDWGPIRSYFTGKKGEIIVFTMKPRNKLRYFSSGNEIELPTVFWKLERRIFPR